MRFNRMLALAIICTGLALIIVSLQDDEHDRIPELCSLASIKAMEAERHSTPQK